MKVKCNLIIKKTSKQANTYKEDIRGGLRAMEENHAMSQQGGDGKILNDEELMRGS